MRADFTSEAWRALALHIEARLKTAREQMENPEMDIDKTNYTRGKIAAYKELLALPQQPAALASNAEPE